MFSKRKHERRNEEGSRVTQSFIIVAVIVLALVDQKIEPKVDIPDIVYYTLAAFYFGVTRPGKEFVDNLLRKK